MMMMKCLPIMAGLMMGLLPAAAKVNFVRLGKDADPTKHRSLNEIHCKPNASPYGECAADPNPYCTPHRSPEHCPITTSFPLLIHKRTTKALSTPSLVFDDGHIFHLLENKLMGYVFTTQIMKLKAPMVLHCEDDFTNALVGGGFTPTAGTGFVIRATNLHSGKAVYVLPQGFGGPELLSGLGSMSANDVVAALDVAGATHIIIEEFIEGNSGPNTVPTEYKMHVIGGKVVSINIVFNRGDNDACTCWAEVDTEWNRLDKYGCFTPTGLTEEGTNIDATDSCYDIDFRTGGKKNYPIKGLDLCGKLPDKPCLDDLIAVAESVGTAIGVYVRVDMFLDVFDNVVVQEYTSNHMGGTRHCSAKLSDDGTCVNACYLGELWNSTGHPEYGGPPPEMSITSAFESAIGLGNPDYELQDICNDVKGIEYPETGYNTTCPGVGTAEPSMAPSNPPSEEHCPPIDCGRNDTIPFEEDIGSGFSIIHEFCIPTTTIPQNLEMCLLSDATGSFREDQDVLRAAAPGIASTIWASSPLAKLGYTAFKDTEDNFVYSLRQTLTANVTDWLAAIDGLHPNGGADSPEGQYDGIACSVDIDYCPNGTMYSTDDCGFSSGSSAKKVIVVTTDAPFSADSDVQNDENSTLTALQENNVVLIGLKAPGAELELDILANATGGTIEPLDSNGANVANALLEGLGSLKTTVEVDTSACSGFNITFDSTSVEVPSGQEACFQATLEDTAGSPPGDHLGCCCIVEFMENGMVVATYSIRLTVV